jgi:alpha-tubulin suppressor-like RCC1 family protein
LLNTNRPAVAVRTSTGAFVTFRELSGGQSHTCGIGVARSLYCWGFEAEGRLFPPSAGTPVRVSTAAESPLAVVASVRSVSAGETHTCAVNVGGILYCSGANDRGQLGTGGTASGAIAARVDGTAGRPTIWSVVAAGERHSCGMPRFSPADSAPPPARPSQRVWCWGANDFGQLGSGFAGDSLAPVLVALPALRVGEDQPAGFDSTSLVAGAAHTCAIEVNGQRRAFCWGSNTFGQVGVGLADTLAFNNPRVVRLSTGEPVAGFVRLYAGEHHTCGILDGGGVRCWGRNQRGQLTGVSSAPLFQPTVITLPSMRALALGELFTCGIEGVPGSPGTTAPLGIVQCWGDNEFGQLGRGTFSPSGHSPLPPGQITSQRIGQ